MTTGSVLEGVRELGLTRRVKAPRELVFAAWTEVKHLAQWWGPKGFTNPRCEADVRPGGAIRIDMRGPNGRVYPMTGRFLEVVPPERLVFMTAALDASGEPMFEIHNTVTFTAIADGTEVALCARVVSVTPAAPQYLAGMSAGWSQSLERLAALVEAISH
jgi:uncharacterized protein YndB with AHSA1/START domain